MEDLTFKERYLSKLTSLGYLSEACREALVHACTIRRLQRGKYLAKARQRALPIAIQLSGISKGYFKDRNDNQKIFAFWHEGEPVGHATTFLSQGECAFYIECLSDSVFAELSYTSYRQLEKEFPEIIPVNQQLILEMTVKAEIKNRIFSKDGFSRYLKFCELHPYHHELKSRDIASYLRLSEQRLSNLKRQHRKDLL